ncbi:helix-turn-helix transcriptional regulator [Microbaculum sp. FT89]|uniref:helix-turn-helix transcriptional regulator n=1 Tax=Microbaculum sp. FT89 TaxID=3447298 RepID=UPI003F52CEBC
MSTALSVYHGRFGRAAIYRLDKSLATHAHREGHIILLIGASDSALTISDQTYALTGSHGVAVNPWQPHNFIAADPINGSVLLVLYIKPLWFLEAGRSADNALRFGRNSIEVTSAVGRLAQRVTSMLLDDESSSLFDGYLYELTRECFDQSWQWKSDEPTNRMSWNGISDFRIRNSLRLMRERMGDEFVLDDIARESGLSRPHFYKLFHQNVGVTPNTYLNTLKMETSLDRLTLSSDPVTTIGLDLGFSSQASFTRFFSTNVGIPPSDYRRATMVLH